MRTFQIAAPELDWKSKEMLLGTSLTKFADTTRGWDNETFGALELHIYDGALVLKIDENGLTGDPTMVQAINKLLSKNA